MKDSFDMGSLIEEFRDEARDQVDRLDAGLLEIERTGGLEPESRSTLLRTLHTLKGNAGMMGLSEVRDYVHVLENALKSEIGAWPAGRIERLFEGAATLRSAVELAGRDGYEEAAGRLAGARHRLEEVESGGVESSDGAQSADAGDVGRDGATDVLRVPFPKLDALLAEVGELLGEADALLASVDGAGQERDLQDLAGAIRRRGDRLRDAAMALRLVPLGRVLSRFPALVRRLAREQEKEARVVLEGEATEVDKSTADALAEPLLHLVRNAVDHGVEPPEVRQREGKPRHGTITIRAAHRGDRVLIDVMDDGAGLPLDRILARARDQGLIEATAEPDARETAALIFRPGFTTRSEVSTVSGR
ncbi:MAG TPA: Hpt domain-containing protein, partial [Longimicrobiales bacterium]|nr:Hpt domain-containing protein [Longimicrobiales bacterium]